ncbi:MAG: HAMP domain-containing protein [Candidatus Thorarchaeota archaeon]|nr:HAMP domain-containing protein [Candidatus Thorarchaeota archaeon]
MAQTKKKGSFRRTVIVTFVAISIVSLAATGTISYFFVNLIGDFTTAESTSALENQIQTNMDLTAQKTALVINQKLTTAESMIAALAEEAERLLSEVSVVEPRRTYYDYFFENGVSGEYPDDTAYDANYDLRVSWNYSSWYVPESNSSNYLTYESQNAERLERISNLDLLFQSVHRQIDFRWLYVCFDSNGLFINYPGSDLGGTDSERTHEPWYTTEDDWYIDIEAEGGSMTFVEPYYDPLENVLLISIGRAIHFQNGTLIGVVAGDITIEDIKQKILDITILDSGYAALLEGTNVVAHPDAGPEDYRDYDNDEVIDLPPLRIIETNADGSPALTIDQVAQIASGATGYLRYTKDGEDYILAYTAVEKPGWICAIIVPVSEVLEAIPALEARIAEANSQASFFIITITIAGIVIAGGAAVAIANQVVGPLQYLMSLATKNVAAMIRKDPLDTLDLQVDTSYISKDDEIGELARAFQGMLDSIREDE